MDFEYRRGKFDNWLHLASFLDQCTLVPYIYRASQVGRQANAVANFEFQDMLIVVAGSVASAFIANYDCQFGLEVSQGLVKSNLVIDGDGEPSILVMEDPV
jgi:hypothetical protein